MTLPILDIGDLEAGGDARAAFLASLREASPELGFFYLTGHGIASEFARGILLLGASLLATSRTICKKIGPR